MDFASDNDNTTEIYATDITISADFRSLTLYVGNSLKFKGNPYEVKPNNYNQGVEIKILNYLGQEKEGATFIDNCFKANKTGTFYLNFIVKTKYNTTKRDSIKISVKNNIDEGYKCIFLKQNVKSITAKESLDISEFVIPYNLGLSNLKYVCSYGRMDGSIFNPNGLGSYNIEIIIDEGDYLIFNIFTVIVNVDEDVGVSLYDVSNNKIENNEIINISLKDKILLFSYIVEGLKNQRIIVEIENIKIVSLISSDAPIIILELNSVGETEIVVKIPNNSYEFKIIVIVE